MNPEEMSDEQLAEAIAPAINPDSEPPKVEPAEEPTPPAEVETPGEPAKVEPVEQPIVEEPAEELPEQPISRRETLRVNKLLEKYGQPSENKAVAPTQQNDFIKTLDAEPEVIEALEANQKSYSDAAYLEGLRQSEVKEWRRDLKYETPVVLEKFPFLDPADSVNFKPAAADAMNRKYLRFIGWNQGDASKGVPESVQYPDISYREFVESEMEFVDELASQKAAETTKNIAKQAATTGLRPDGSSAKRLNLNQAPENMSNEELYAAIGQKPPTN